jgi:hypothetical protein
MVSNMGPVHTDSSTRDRTRSPNLLGKKPMAYNTNIHTISSREESENGKIRSTDESRINERTIVIVNN